MMKKKTKNIDMGYGLVHFTWYWRVTGQSAAYSSWNL